MERSEFDSELSPWLPEQINGGVSVGTRIEVPRLVLEHAPPIISILIILIDFVEAT